MHIKGLQLPCYSSWEGTAGVTEQNRGSSEEALNRRVCLEPKLVSEPGEELTQVCTSR